MKGKYTTLKRVLAFVMATAIVITGIIDRSIVAYANSASDPENALVVSKMIKNVVVTDMSGNPLQNGGSIESSSSVRIQYNLNNIMAKPVSGDTSGIGSDICVVEANKEYIFADNFWSASDPTNNKYGIPESLLVVSDGIEMPIEKDGIKLGKAKISSGRITFTIDPAFDASDPNVADMLFTDAYFGFKLKLNTIASNITDGNKFTIQGGAVKTPITVTLSDYNKMPSIVKTCEDAIENDEISWNVTINNPAHLNASYQNGNVYFVDEFTENSSCINEVTYVKVSVLKDGDSTPTDTIISSGSLKYIDESQKSKGFYFLMPADAFEEKAKVTVSYKTRVDYGKGQPGDNKIDMPTIKNKAKLCPKLSSDNLPDINNPFINDAGKELVSETTKNPSKI